jgi:rSAM/selenodomain-associated transferase 2/rSAM/selenodomain-associated transferase 1
VHSTTQAQLSIIIPTLNEASHLPALLNDLKKQKGISFEVIVGDGGSSDATKAIAESYGAGFITATRGRGAQMNAASEHADADVLLFLHADSRLADPWLLSNALQALTSEISWQDRIAGHFSLRFIRSTRQNAIAYRFAEEKTAFNRVNSTNGDQGLLLSKIFFRQLCGFDTSLPFLEDQRIAEKIRSQGKWITLPGYLETSARRFETEGFHRRYILMSMMMGLHSVDVHEFFIRAPDVYRAQVDTGRLCLSPFFDLVWRMMCEEWGLKSSLRIFYLLGRYIRQHSWQLFFFIDVCLRPLLGKGRYPFLNFHDRFFAPCTNCKVFNALTGLLCFLWYMGILAPYFRIMDKRNSKVRSAIALFVRSPLPGQVKTRLGREIGNDKACAFYLAMVQDALNATTGSGETVYLFHDGAASGLPGEWLNVAHAVVAQQGESIGERMAAAFELLFSEGLKSVALLGSDIPGIDAELLRRSLHALESNDVAIVPAVDGGYCLIALNSRKFTGLIFQNIEWSTEHVLRTTLERCAECRLRVALLEPRQDIDTVDDVREYCRQPSLTAYVSNAWLVAAGYLQDRA